MLESLSELPLSPWPGRANVQIVRGDLIHPIVSGNKLYKLQPFLDRLVKQDSAGMISVGGRYSNHLHALAYACHRLGRQSVGLVRGYAGQPLTPTLQDCQSWGMVLHFVSHLDYEQRYQDGFWHQWQVQYPGFIQVNEGGWTDTELSANGTWWQSIPPDIDCVICPVGSGTTLAGLCLTAPEGVNIVGVPAFRDPDNYQSLHARLRNVGVSRKRYELWSDRNNRGFGKLTEEQRLFKIDFERSSNVELDPVYTAKSFHALHCRLAAEAELKTRRVAILHTGGLQGNRT